MIYALEILKQKFVKIGFSEHNNVAVRIAALQTGCPFKLSPIMTVEGTIRQEQALHASLIAAFGRIRIPMPPGEWYHGRNPFFVEFLDRLRVSPNAALAFAETYNPSVRQPGKKSGCDPNLRWPDRG